MRQTTQRQNRKILSDDDKHIRDGRFVVLKANLEFIAHQYPRVQALYPLMDTVAYQDFETLIATAIEDHDPANAQE